MADRADLTPAGDDTDERRQQQIVDVLVDAFADLMAADAEAFRTKFRKMAADPFAFYRGSACLFYADMATGEDRWSDERTSRVWIHGDLHAENFGTYMDANGRIVFDVNDFDEAYLGHVSWDLRRFAASFALLAWRKALADDVISEMLGGYLDAYLDQVAAFTLSDDDRLLIQLRETEALPWKDIAARFSEGKDVVHTTARLQMKYKRLRQRFRVWEEQDLHALRVACEYYEKCKWDIISAKVCRFSPPM